MSGRRALSVVRFRLDPSLGDPREQIRRQTTDLEPGTNVRVISSIAPIPLGFPIANYLDTAWYRSDLNWQFEATPASADWARDWEAIANYLGGFND